MKRFLIRLLWLMLSPGIALAVECNGRDPCESQPGAVTPPLNAAKFVDCSLAASGNGTVTTPWNRIANINGMSPGDDLLFKAGTTCALQVLVVNWAGTTADPVVISSYYMQSGAAVLGTPTNFTPSVNAADLDYGAHPRAILQGSYLDSCRNSAAFQTTANKCAWNTAHGGGINFDVPGIAVPTSHYGSMISVAGTGARNVIVQDLDVRASAGSGVSIDNTPHITCTGQSSCATFVTVRRVRIDGVAHDAIAASNVSNNVFMFNDISRDQLATADRAPGAQTDWRGGATIHITGCDPCQDLVEANDIHDIYGEGVGVYGAGIVLVRGNRFGSMARAGIDVAGSRDIVREQNLMASGAVTSTDKAVINGTGYGIGPPFAGLYYEYDPAQNIGSYFTGNVALSHTLDRNNLIGTPTADCINQYVTAATATGTQFLDSRAYGNVCITGTADEALQFNISTNLPIVNFIDAKNNLLVTDADACFITNQGGKVTYNFNLWTTLQTNAQCRGASDKVGASGLGSFNFAAGDWRNMPTPNDFKPTGGVGANLAQPLTATLPELASALWDPVLANRVWLPVGNTTGQQVPRAEWNKQWTTDFNGNPRSATPDMGAFEHNP